MTKPEEGMSDDERLDEIRRLVRRAELAFAAGLYDVAAEMIAQAKAVDGARPRGRGKVEGPKR